MDLYFSNYNNTSAPVSGSNTVTGGTAVGAGDLTIGSTDSGTTISGTTGITLDSSVQYKYISVTTGTSYTATSNDYMIDVQLTVSSDFTVTLPDSDGSPGRYYIVSKGYAGNTLTVTTNAADKIDGDDSYTLTQTDERVKFISSDDNRWLIV